MALRAGNDAARVLRRIPDHGFPLALFPVDVIELREFAHSTVDIRWSRKLSKDLAGSRVCQLVPAHGMVQRRRCPGQYRARVADGISAESALPGPSPDAQ